MIPIDWRGLDRVMNPIPYKTITDPNRNIIHIGGAGSGKSHGHGQKVAYYTANKWQGRNTLICRKVGDTNRSSTFALMCKVINEFNLSSIFNIRESDMTIRCVNGNTILFRGLDNVEKIKSVTFSNGILTDIWIEEASEITEADFDQLDLRLRGETKNNFQITMLLNPIDSLHWIKRRFFDNKEKNTSTYRSTYKDNRWIDAQYKEKLEALQYTNPYLYQVYACGEWGNAGDIVFKNVRYERCPYSYGDFDEVVTGMDFGFTHYHAIELIGFKDGKAYSFRELYVNRKTNSECIIENERKKILPKDQLCTCDSAEPKSIADWRNAGYYVQEAKKGPDSVRMQYQYLAGMEWIIDPVACPGLAAETRGFSYRKDKNGIVREIDEASGFYDDALAACRYAIESKAIRNKFEIW